LKNYDRAVIAYYINANYTFDAYLTSVCISDERYYLHESIILFLQICITFLSYVQSTQAYLQCRTVTSLHFYSRRDTLQYFSYDTMCANS